MTVAYVGDPKVFLKSFNSCQSTTTFMVEVWYLVQFVTPCIMTVLPSLLLAMRSYTHRSHPHKDQYDLCHSLLHLLRVNHVLDISSTTA